METFVASQSAEVLARQSKINSLEVSASTKEGSASDDRWQQAELVAEQLKYMTQRELAEAWKKPDGTSYSQSHIKFVKKTWETFEYYSTQDRPTWYEAYNSDEVRKSGKTTTPEPKDFLDMLESIVNAVGKASIFLREEQVTDLGENQMMDGLLRQALNEMDELVMLIEARR